DRVVDVGSLRRRVVRSVRHKAEVEMLRLVGDRERLALEIRKRLELAHRLLDLAADDLRAVFRERDEAEVRQAVHAVSEDDRRLLPKKADRLVALLENEARADALVGLA